MIARTLVAVAFFGALAGCAKKEEAPAARAIPRVATAPFRLHLPPPQGIPDQPSMRNGVPLPSAFAVGREAPLAFFEGLDTVMVPIQGQPQGSARSLRAGVPYKRWFVPESVTLDSLSGDAVSVMVEKLESFRQDAEWPRSDGDVLFLRGGIVSRIFHQAQFTREDSNLTAEYSRMIGAVALHGGRNLLIVRSEAAPGAPGEERYEAFGVGPDGTLRQFSGAFEYVRDADLPASLRDGEVFYVHIPRGCFHFLVPVTLDLQRQTFIAECGDDAVFSAAGDGHPRLEGSESLTLPLYLHPAITSLQRSVTLYGGSSITATRFYGPWFAFPKNDPRFDRHDWLQVRVDSLVGWVPDTLYPYLGFSQCGTMGG